MICKFYYWTGRGNISKESQRLGARKLANPKGATGADPKAQRRAERSGLAIQSRPNTQNQKSLIPNTKYRKPQKYPIFAPHKTQALKKVIFYLIDGARPDILSRLAQEGKLPNIQKYMIEQGSFTKGTTCFPSTTGPAYLPFLTGAFPGEHHITGIRWFDKKAFKEKGRWFRNSMRSYCGPESNYFNADMNPDLPSLFEDYSDGINLYNMVTKGVKVENDITKKGKGLLYTKAHFMHKHHEVDRLGHEKLLGSLDKNSRFTFAVFPSIDWDSHNFHYDDPETTHKAYKIVDDSLGEVVEKLKKMGSYEDTLIVMASDHGLSSTNKHFDLGDFFRSEKYRVLEYPNIFKIKPNLTVFISGNSFASISFLDKIEDYKQDEILSKHGKAVNNLVNNKGIDFILMRGDANDYCVMNENGFALIAFHENNKLTYHPKTNDVFGLGEITEPLDIDGCFDATFESNYPDSLWQCHQLMQSHRAGDIVISAAIGYDLRDFWEYPEHKGSHGSLHWEHIHIPILTNQKDLIDKPVRSIEVHKVIKDWIG